MQQKPYPRTSTSHLSEISFLLTQRIALFHDPEVEWRRIGEFEERLLAHVDGIVEGGEPAARVAIEWLVDSDSDNVRAAAYALPFTNSKDALPAVIEALQKADPELVTVFVDALKFTECSILASQLLPLLNHNQPHIRAATVEILGYRREVDAMQLVPLLDDPDTTVVAAAARALRRIGASPVTLKLQQALARLGPSDGLEIAITLLDEPSLTAFCAGPKSDRARSLPYAAFLGIPFKSEQTTVADIQYRGLSGLSEQIPELIQALDDKNTEIRAAAAQSLEMITGAGLVETVEETQEFTDPDGNVVDSETTAVTRISQSAATWRNWWSQNQGQFKGGGRQRYRRGQPINAQTLIAELTRPIATYYERHAAACELAALHGAKYRLFEPDWFVKKQQSALAGWR